jgi:hypothetical protein
MEALHERSSLARRGSLEIALTAIATDILGGDAWRDIERLVAMQSEAGSWDDFCPLFRLGSRTPQIFFGSVAQNTAFAIRALSGGRVYDADMSGITAHGSAWMQPMAELWLRALDAS